MLRLTKQHILVMHDRIIEKTGGDSGIRDEGLLESAINAPFQSFGGTEPYPSLQQKAARLCYGLVMDHPFFDGNKRIGTHAMLVFLQLNGITLLYDQSELVNLILNVADGKIDTANLLDWIIAHQE